MVSTKISPDDVLKFWLGLPKEAYFKRDEALDAEITERFADALETAKAGQLDHWPRTVEGTLALVILLDQFSRNIHRDTPAMFAADDKALDVVRNALAAGVLEKLPCDQQQWLVMPLMHSENLTDQERCVDLCKQAGLDETTPFAIEHADIIRQFGRFPHRNEVLDRETTPEEIAFLKNGGFAG